MVTAVFIHAAALKTFPPHKEKLKVFLISPQPNLFLIVLNVEGCRFGCVDPLSTQNLLEVVQFDGARMDELKTIKYSSEEEELFKSLGWNSASFKPEMFDPF